MSLKTILIIFSRAYRTFNILTWYDHDVILSFIFFLNVFNKFLFKIHNKSTLNFPINVF